LYLSKESIEATLLEEAVKIVEASGMKVLGKEKTFLIQNIFPTTEKYIESKYQNKMQDVEITKSLKKEIIETSMNVIKLSKKGINIPFYDILEMKETLLKNK